MSEPERSDVWGAAGRVGGKGYTCLEPEDSGWIPQEEPNSTALWSLCSDGEESPDILVEDLLAIEVNSHQHSAHFTTKRAMIYRGLLT